MDKSSPERVIEAASSYIGKPFRHHFKPVDVCQHGFLTADQCMAVGMDETGFDCSGLVIASVCKAIGVDTDRWQREYRHFAQLIELIEPDDAQPGDALILTYSDHIGIMSDDRHLIHANGKTKIVETNNLKGSFAAYAAIPLSTLVELVG